MDTSWDWIGKHVKNEECIQVSLFAAFDTIIPGRMRDEQIFAGRKLGLSSAEACGS